MQGCIGTLRVRIALSQPCRTSATGTCSWSAKYTSSTSKHQRCRRWLANKRAAARLVKSCVEQEWRASKARSDWGQARKTRIARKARLFGRC